jgi:hypothetical protein
MAYEGETVRITATVTDFDGDPIVPAEVTSAVVNLYDGSGNYVFTDTPLTYQDVGPETPTAYWFYDWQDILVGSWIAQCVFTGAAYEVYEYVTVKVKAPKIAPTGLPSPSLP